VNPSTGGSIPLPAAIRSTRLAFALAGVLIAAWAPLVPYAKARLAVGDAGLGSLLLCLGLGALATMPFAGTLGRRLGARTLMAAASVLALLVLPALAWLDTAPTMTLALLAFGAALGLLDIAANLQAAAIERRSGRPLMSGFHGAWSVGTIVGGGLTSALLAQLGLSPLGAAGLLSLVAAATTLAMLGGLEPREDRPQTGQADGNGASRWALPHGQVWVLALMCMTVYLVEHSVLDWSAVFMSSERGADPASAGWAYTGFAAAMTLGRLQGDRLRSWLGDVAVVLVGGLLSAAGLALVVAVASTAAGLAGYALLGLGASNIVPVLFSAAGRDHSLGEGRALTAVATVAFFGALGGPALIGWLAHATSLGTSFIVLAVAMLAVAAGGRRLGNAAPAATASPPQQELTT
jgi:predicted MFS family arabinose efflux permease